MISRLLLGFLGVALAGWGVSWMFERPDDLIYVGLWLGGSTVAHDFIVVPIALVVGAIIARYAPPTLRRTLVRALIVLGPLSIIAIPVLGRYGAKPDNPTLLDGNYLAGWAIIVTATLAVSAAIAVVEARRAPNPAAGTLSDE